MRERVDDWKRRLEQGLHRKVVELTGDVTPDGTRGRSEGVSCFEFNNPPPLLL